MNIGLLVACIENITITQIHSLFHPEKNYDDFVEISIGRETWAA